MALTINATGAKGPTQKCYCGKGSPHLFRVVGDRETALTQIFSRLTEGNSYFQALPSRWSRMAPRCVEYEVVDNITE